MATGKVFSLDASPTLARFMLDAGRYKSVIGPYGSGKSAACIHLIVKKAIEMPPSVKDGVRRSRVLVVRNTLKSLKDTTLDSFFEEYPPGDGWGRFWAVDFRYVMSFGLQDGTAVELEVLFRPLEEERDEERLKSLQLTGAWVNEASAIRFPKLFGSLRGRIDRFPKNDHFDDPNERTKHSYVILDSNPPAVGDWLYCIHEGLDPSDPTRPMETDWRCYNQPAGDGPQAENMSRNGGGLTDGYYANMIKGGMTDEEIRVIVRGEYARLSRGKAVHSSFSPGFHVSSDQLWPTRDGVIVFGGDAGLTPSTVFGQSRADGGVDVLRELPRYNMSAYEYVHRHVRPFVAQHFPNNELVGFLDPASNQRSQADGATVLDVWRDAGFNVYLAETNNVQERLRAVDVLLSGQTLGGPMLRFDPRVRTLINGLSFGYRFHPIRRGEIDKNSRDGRTYSHTVEALHYFAMHVQSARSSWSFGSRIHDEQFLAEAAQDPWESWRGRRR